VLWKEDVNLLHSFPLTMHDLEPLSDWPTLRFPVLTSTDQHPEMFSPDQFIDQDNI
jgi:hypothetical protein